MRYNEATANRDLHATARGTIQQQPHTARKQRQQQREQRMVRILEVVAPGTAVGLWLRFGGYAAIVFAAASFGSR
jgi:hypothetical protein